MEYEYCNKKVYTLYDEFPFDKDRFGGYERKHFGKKDPNTKKTVPLYPAEHFLRLCQHRCLVGESILMCVVTPLGNSW